MKKTCGILALVMLVGSVAWANASANGCLRSNNKAAGCVVAMPEPSAIPEVILCMAGIGLFTFRLRGLNRVLGLCARYDRTSRRVSEGDLRWIRFSSIRGIADKGNGR